MFSIKSLAAIFIMMLSAVVTAESTSNYLPGIVNDGFIDIKRSKTYFVGPKILYCTSKVKVNASKKGCYVKRWNDKMKNYDLVNEGYGVSAQEYLNHVYGNGTTQFVGVNVGSTNSYYRIFYKVTES